MAVRARLSASLISSTVVANLPAITIAGPTAATMAAMETIQARCDSLRLANHFPSASIFSPTAVKTLSASEKKGLSPSPMAESAWNHWSCRFSVSLRMPDMTLGSF